MNNIEFKEWKELVVKNDILFVNIKNVHSKKELLLELNEKLSFPPYFGFNWDALWDLYCDFHWVSQYDIYILIIRVLQLYQKTISLFISV